MSIVQNMHKQGGVTNEAGRPNAGIDVSKQHLDVCWGAESLRVDNQASGWEGLIAKLQAAGVDLVVVEATGGYERGAVCALQEAGLAVARVNPRQARDFAKSMGTLAKTDQVDARSLRAFADVLSRHQERDKFITAPPNPQREQLAALMVRRRQLIDMRVAETNRLEQATKKTAQSIRGVIKYLDRQLRTIDNDIDNHLDRHFESQRDLLDTVTGVGPVTILTLIAILPELGRYSRRQICKLVGVAPLANDSGPRKGSRHIWGGRAPVRSVLYMSTIAAITHNPAIRAFYQRLIAAGKPKKVAIVAAMRKLLTILNAMMRDRAVWDAARHVQTGKMA